MAASITQFANLTAPVLPEIDNTFLAYTPLTVIPCTVSGTNALTLTPSSGSAAATPTITAYQNYMRFSGVFANNGTGVLTARVGALAVLNVYKDTFSGVAATNGSEAVQNCAFTLIYDAALNSGSGGWHLYTGTGSFNGGTITNPLVGTTITANLFNGTTASITGVTALNSLNVSGPVSLASLSLSGVGKLAGASISGPSTLSSLQATGPATLASLNVSGLATLASLGVTGPATLASLAVSGLGSITKLEVGAGGASITRIVSGQATVAYTVTNANATQDQTLTLTGAQADDSLSLGLGPSTPAGAGFTGFMAAAGTVTLRLVNPQTVTLGAATLTVRATAIGFS